MSSETDPRTDEEIAYAALEAWRTHARHILFEAKSASNPDVRDVLEGAAEQVLKQTRAVHRLLQKAGVRGLGPIDY